MNRERRAQIAQETLAILTHGTYTIPGQPTVTIGPALAAACAATRLYRPDDYAALMTQAASLPADSAPEIHVRNCTTLAAAFDLSRQYQHVICLNFASAKNPGGGFRSGAQAQEESLARASGLYATLQSQPEYYSYHKQQGTSLYSDHMIFSPHVPVFRNDQDELLPTPWQTSFITAAAVNAGAVADNEPTRLFDLAPTMRQRTRMVLAVALANGCDALVLGAWGCGVFRNDPGTIAKIIAGALHDPSIRNRLRRVDFAILDRSPSQENINPFHEIFASQ